MRRIKMNFCIDTIGKLKSKKNIHLEKIIKTCSGFSKIFILSFLVSFIGIAQDQSNPNVELPDFIITGTDVVTIRQAKKIKPEIVSTISEGFLKPVFSPEELEVRDLSNPVKDEINLFDTLNFLRGNLKAGVGVYTMPVAEFSYAFPFAGGIFDASAFGNNQRAHVDNSGRLSAGGAVNVSLFVENESAFLPGTQFKLHGDYGFSSYKFYASSNPEEERISNKGNLGISANNLLSDVFIFGGELSNDFSSLNDEKFTENLLNVNGFSKLELANFNLTANVNYKYQSVTNDRIDGSYGYLGFRPTVGLVFSEVLKAFFGFNYAYSNGNNFFSPYASVALKINKNLALYGRFTPQAEFVTAGNLLKQNPYYNVQNKLNFFVEKQGVVNASLKYEYDKYFQIDGGVEIAYSDSMPYFQNSSLSGRFDLAVADAKSFTGFINLLFHPGPFGMFYGEAQFNSTTDGSGNRLPYHPVIKSNFVYGYNFDFGLNIQSNLEFNSSSFADIANRQKINAFVDLGLHFAYRVSNNFHLTFEFNNLFGNENFRWAGYKETPLDIIAGFNYKW